ncbi:MAG: response regulator [Actinobacteria bacterium]|nr:response regulator [Actinomycetota bacterium]
MSNDAARILVVEDEEDLANVVRVNLEIAGYDVEHTLNGAEALDEVRDERPDLILLDVMMPVMDGWQVLRALKEDDDTRDIPVVMLTALAEEQNIIQGHLEGAVRYLTKPFEVKKLLEVVETTLDPDEEELERRRRTVRTLLERLAELESGRPAGAEVHLSKLENPPRRPRGSAPTDEDRSKLAELTSNQRYLADQLAAGRSAREMAQELDVSRSNVYATRKRIARKLGVDPNDVADEARRLGLGS